MSHPRTTAELFEVFSQPLKERGGEGSTGKDESGPFEE